MISDVIGGRIRTCRLQNELTQEALAKLLFVSHQTVSKWENGLLTPDVNMLVKLSCIFQVSMDYLCGTKMGEQEKAIKDIIQNTNYESFDDFDELKEVYEQLAKKVELFPLNDELLNHQLHLLRKWHDTVQSDEQKVYVNELVLKCAERILDISKNDGYRSYANFNMAIYYNEQPCDSNTLRKSRKYADRVLYKDMIPAWYLLFGTKWGSDEDIDALRRAIDDSVETIKTTLKNLANRYRFQGNREKYESLREFERNFDLEID